MPAVSERWDIFCRVVDNFGDVGVSWRLARQVAHEHGKRVTLWLDDLTVLAKLRSDVDPAYDLHAIDGVEVRRVREPFEAFEPDEVADVVVETFGCDPPEAYVQAMAARQPRPRWINLEYLSAETWVEGSHALPSPHPRLPLTKHFYFPGFTPRTGGLLREAGLLERRDAFQADAGAQAAFWRSVAGRAPPEGALKVSLFSYSGPPLDSLARASMQHPGPVWLLATEGAASAALQHWGAGMRSSIRRTAHQGNRRRDLEVIPVPFLSQERYDQLLWACDVNFVRGEDSFVRAQWAARPFAWNVYPTDDGAHWLKMAAFLERYTASLDRAQAGAVTALWEAWNRRDSDRPDPGARPSIADAWSAFLARRPALEAHARAWCDGLARQRDLADGLVDFCDHVLE